MFCLVPRDRQVGDVKASIEADKGADFPAAHTKLIYQGKVLADETTLEAAGVSESGFMVVMVKKPKKSAAPAAVAPPKEDAAPAAAKEEATKEGETKTPAASAAPAPTPAAPERPAAPAATGGADATPAAAAAPAADEGTPDYGSAASTMASGSALQETIGTLCAMGFAEDEVKRALRAAFNNPDRAVEYLTTGLPPEFQEAPPAAAAAAAAAPGGGGEGTGAGDAAAAIAAAAAAAEAGGAAGAAAAAGGGAGGPNAQPLNMWNPGAQAGAEGGAGSGSLDFLRQHPQFQALRSMVQTNPSILQPMLQELGKQNPQLLQVINSNQSEFLRIINEPVSAAEQQSMAAMMAGALGGEGDMDAEGPGVVNIELTEEDRANVDTLMAMGFSEAAVVQAYLACDKNPDLAANYLFEHGMDEQ